jgi:signal transduction histidine kinase
MGAPRRWYAGYSVHPVAADVALALVILAINLIQPGDRHSGEQIDLTVTGVLLVVIAAGSLLFRRRAPLVVLAITMLAVTGYAITEQVKSPIGLALAAAIYTVVIQKDRLTRLVALVSVAVITVTVATLFTDGNLLANISVAVLVLFGAAIGEAVRNRRAYQAEFEARIRRAEQTREEEAERRVIEERLRIAHELHDVIAHHIALMNVQAGVASHLLREQPDEADRALALVREGGRTVLRELTVLLGVLQPVSSSTGSRRPPDRSRT